MKVNAAIIRKICSTGFLKLLSFIVLFFLCKEISGQSPNQPTNPSPANNTQAASISPALCANVSDPNGGNLRVRYYGRPKPITGVNQKFTVILLPDTQYYTEQPQGTGNNAMFKAQTAWIASNRQSMNIVYVGQLGDCAQNGDAQDVEWKRADTAMSMIESQALTGLPQGIPYGICVGNHDQSPIGGGSTATTVKYNQYFGSSRFIGRNYYGGHEGTMNNDNHYELFSASGIDFLVISMEYDETPETIVLDWASNLVQTYSNRKVIVMTHYGINDAASGTPAFGVQGLAIYNKLKEYPNFILFVCGHNYSTDGEARRIDTYNDNILHTILSDYQGRTNGGHGLLRIMEFDPVTNKISVKTFSPYDNNGAGVYETDADSQFELSVNLNSLIGESNNVSSGSTACKTWAGLNQLTEYEWYVQLYDGVNTTTGPVWTFTTPGNIPVPVKLINFTAQVESSKRIKINWTTAYERNSSHFDVERSKDGIHFVAISTIPAKINSNSLEDYSIYDNQPYDGVSFYRLKQVDIDGKMDYSKIIRINISDSKSVADIFPNPADEKSFTIGLLKNIAGSMDIKIYDMKGRLQLHQQFTNGRDIIVNHHLASGIYIVKITGQELAENKKLIIK